MCKRAGKLIVGFDVCKQSMIDNEAQIILTASDISSKTLKEVVFLTDKYNIPHKQIDIEIGQLWYLIGKRAGVISILDDGFAKSISKLLQPTE